jgi:hypothetical protein
MTDPMLESIVRTSINFFVRRNLTGVPATHSLQRLFMSIISDIGQLRGQKVVDKVTTRLRNAVPDDATFRAKLASPIYDENVDVTRYILVCLAQESMTNESFVDLWEREGKHYKWSIEHILPQGSHLPSEWVSMLGGPEVAVSVQQQHVHRLGNLTLTGYNSTLGNRSFDFKKKRKDSKGNYVGYKNGFGLNADVVASPAWTLTEIDKRTEDLVERALKAFSL